MINRVEDEILGMLDNKQRMLKKKTFKVIRKSARGCPIRNLQDSIVTIDKQIAALEELKVIKVRKLNELVVR